MSFLSWASLAIAGLVVAPLIAHLLRRRPPDIQVFPAARLVPQRDAVAQRRRSIDDRALFGTRALAVILLALLGATPLLRCSRLSLSRASGASVAMTLVVDDSLSMRAALTEGGTTTRFAKAKQAAGELMAGLRAGDAVAIVLAGDPARVALAATSNLAVARAALEHLDQTDRGTDLHGAVALAGELVAELEHVDKRVVVLSDLATYQHDKAIEAPPGTKLWFPVEALKGARANCAVVTADRRRSLVVAQVVCNAEADATHRRTRRLQIMGGGKVLAETPLPAALKTPLQIKVPGLAALKPAGRLEAVLSGADAIAADDRAPLTQTSAQIEVALLFGDGATVATGGPPPVQQALAALQLEISLRPLSAVPERPEELASTRLLVVDDVPGFTPTEREDLGDWVRAGGVMLLTLGQTAAMAPLGAGFAPMLPATIRWATTAPEGLDRDRDQLFGGVTDGLGKLRARGRARLDLEASEQLSVLSYWQDGAPFAYQRRLGRGVVIALTLPLDASQSDFVLRPGFLRLLSRLVEMARGRGGVARKSVGDPWVVHGFQQVKVARVEPDGRRSPLAGAVQVLPKNKRAVTVEELGLYELSLDGEGVMRVAAVDPREVELAPAAIAESEIAPGSGDGESQVDVSQQLALALLALFAAELWLRVRGRPARRTEAAS